MRNYAPVVCKFISVMGVGAVISVIAAISRGRNQIAITVASAPKRKTYSNGRANVIIKAARSSVSTALSPREPRGTVVLLPAGTSYKFRVVAVNVIGSSPPSAPSKAYAVVVGRTPERPVDGPYITYNEAINETSIILKWTVGDRNEAGTLRLSWMAL